MIFFGWGRNNKTQELSADQALVLGYSYFHVFWLFRLSFGLKYSLATLTDAGWAARPLSAEEATAGGAQAALSLHWWWRFGLFVGIAMIVVIAMFDSLG